MKHKRVEQDQATAYHYEVDEFGHFEGRKDDDFEPEPAPGREQARGGPRVDRDRARFDTLDAWQRLRDQVER